MKPELGSTRNLHSGSSDISYVKAAARYRGSAAPRGSSSSMAATTGLSSSRHSLCSLRKLQTDTSSCQSSWSGSQNQLIFAGPLRSGIGDRLVKNPIFIEENTTEYLVPSAPSLGCDGRSASSPNICSTTSPSPQPSSTNSSAHHLQDDTQSLDFGFEDDQEDEEDENDFVQGHTSNEFLEVEVREGLKGSSYDAVSNGLLTSRGEYHNDYQIISLKTTNSLERIACKDETTICSDNASCQNVAPKSCDVISLGDDRVPDFVMVFSSREGGDEVSRERRVRGHVSRHSRRTSQSEVMNSESSPSPSPPPPPLPPTTAARLERAEPTQGNPSSVNIAKASSTSRGDTNRRSPTGIGEDREVGRRPQANGDVSTGVVTAADDDRSGSARDLSASNNASQFTSIVSELASRFNKNTTGNHAEGSTNTGKKGAFSGVAGKVSSVENDASRTSVNSRHEQLESGSDVPLIQSTSGSDTTSDLGDHRRSVSFIHGTLDNEGQQKGPPSPHKSSHRSQKGSTNYRHKPGTGKAHRSKQTTSFSAGGGPNNTPTNKTGSRISINSSSTSTSNSSRPLIKQKTLSSQRTRTKSASKTATRGTAAVAAAAATATADVHVDSDVNSASDNAAAAAAAPAATGSSRDDMKSRPTSGSSGGDRRVTGGVTNASSSDTIVEIEGDETTVSNKPNQHPNHNSTRNMETHRQARKAPNRVSPNRKHTAKDRAEKAKSAKAAAKDKLANKDYEQMIKKVVQKTRRNRCCNVAIIMLVSMAILGIAAFITVHFAMKRMEPLDTKTVDAQITTHLPVPST